MSERCLLVFAKPPVPGRVKTRLHGSLLPQQAAELHAALLQDLLDRMSGGDYDVMLCWAWRDTQIDRVMLGPAVETMLQQGADLGERMHHAADSQTGRYDRVCIVGSDVPALDRAAVEAAFTAMEACDVVLGPATDGGYYLIGAAHPGLPRGLFTDCRLGQLQGPESDPRARRAAGIVDDDPGGGTGR